MVHWLSVCQCTVDVWKHLAKQFWLDSFGLSQDFCLTFIHFRGCKIVSMGVWTAWRQMTSLGFQERIGFKWTTDMSELLNVIEISIEDQILLPSSKPLEVFTRCKTQGTDENGGSFFSWNGYHALEVILFEQLYTETRRMYDVWVIEIVESHALNFLEFWVNSRTTLPKTYLP